MKHHSKRLVPKTLLQIFKYVAITTLVMVLSIAGILYRDYEKIGLRTAYDYNIRYLRQVSYNISYMNDYIVQYCITQYSEPDMQNFLYTPEESDDAFYFNYIRSIGKLQNTVLISPMIHSVVVYNSYLDRVYSTSPFFSNEDVELRELFMNKAAYEVLRPVPRIIPNNLYYRDRGVLEEKIKLFTYIMTESNHRDKPGSALAVNIDTEWIFNNLKENAESGNDGSNLLLIDSSGMVIADESDAAREFELLPTDYLTGIKNHDEKGGSFILETESGKKVITCLTIPELNWTLVNEQPYASVMNFIEQAKLSTFAAVAVFCVLALVAAFFASKGIYNPIDKLVFQVKLSFAKEANTANAKNELDYIQKAFDISVEHIRKLENYKESTRDLLKEYMITSIIADNSAHMLHLSEAELGEIVDLFQDGEMIIVLVKLDGYNQLPDSSVEERKYLRFLITNTFQEKLTDTYPVETVTLSNGEIAFIINIEGTPYKNAISEIKTIISNIQAYMLKTASVSFSAFISELAKNKKHLYSCYKDLSDVVKYRIMYSANCILDKAAVEMKMSQNQQAYPEGIEKNITGGIFQMDLDGAIDAFELFMKEILNMNIDNFMLSLSRLAISLDRTIHQMNINRVGEIRVGFNAFFIAIFKMETIDDIRAKFHEYISQIVEQAKATSKNKNSHIVNQITQYIQENYSDKNLNLKDIAYKFKISYGYMLVLFKESNNESLSEYLNRFRLEKAAELLATTDYSISRIMSCIGYDNESNFYRLFRKHFGTTPREYRLTRTLERKANDS